MTIRCRCFLKVSGEQQCGVQNCGIQHSNGGHGYDNAPLPHASVSVHAKCHLRGHHSHGCHWPYRYSCCLRNMEDRQIRLYCDAVCVLRSPLYLRSRWPCYCGEYTKIPFCSLLASLHIITHIHASVCKICVS